jgi:hypothetical protein
VGRPGRAASWGMPWETVCKKGELLVGLL